jgi:uncharacterized protein (DUF58 family)
MKNWLRKVFSKETSAADALAQPAVATSAQASGAESLLRRLEWSTIKRLDGMLQGDYRTLMRGFGLDLADLREYQSTDDVRHIDWNVTARHNVPHVRVFTEDREMSAWFLLDLSASVDFGSGERSKRLLSTEFVTVLSRVLTRHGNRVGALLYGGGSPEMKGVDKLIPSGSGRRHILQLVHDMLAHRAQSGANETRLTTLLKTADHVIRRRSTVFVVSDFFSEPGWDEPLAMLARRHDVIAVRLVDPLEVSLPDIGMISLRDAETGETKVVDSFDPKFRRRFAEISAEREASLRDGLARAGVDTLELSTQDDVAQALLRFAALRRRKSRLRSNPQHSSAATQHHILTPEAA